MCYAYDSLNRVIKRQVISLDCDCVVSEENYNYDAAGNITEGDKRTVPLSLMLKGGMWFCLSITIMQLL